jgi:hypothetical protein
MSARGNQPRTASAVTRQFFRVLDELGVSQSGLAGDASLHVNTFYGWKTGKAGASVPNMEAALAVLGLELFIRPISNPEPEGKLT